MYSMPGITWGEVALARPNDPDVLSSLQKKPCQLASQPASKQAWMLLVLMHFNNYIVTLLLESPNLCSLTHSLTAD